MKDLIDVGNTVTGCGNPTWKQTHPKATVNAVCIDQLLTSGATLIGKTISDELAYSLIGENYFYGTPINPKTPNHVPGGSSSGSASAVACELVDFALGTDTGGSVRVPASNCGIWGFRPTHGRISVAGVNPFAPTFDTVGVFANQFSILQKVINILLGSTSEDTKKQLEIIFLEDMFQLCDNDIQQTMSLIRSDIEKRLPYSSNTLGAIVEEPINHLWLFDTYSLLQCTEIWSTLGTWIEETQPKFGPVTEINFRNLAKKADRTKIQNAIRKRERFANRINRYLGNNRVFCFPTTPILAPKLNTIGKETKNRSQSTYFPRALAMTSISGLSRAPQINIPCANINNVPIGLSLIASAGNDSLLLELQAYLKLVN